MDDNSCIDVGGTSYVLCEGVLLQCLADGTPGPAVGHIDTADGGVTIDPDLAAGEWVGELLTATLPRAAAPAAVPVEVADAIHRGGAAEWRGALDATAVAQCRAAVEQLEAEGSLSRSHHGQDSTTRGDRIAFVRLDGDAADAADADSNDDADDEDGERCPPALRRGFDLLESVGSQLEAALGCGRLLVPRLGMVAVYDQGRSGYVRHLDNERIHPASGAGAAATAADGEGMDADSTEPRVLEEAAALEAAAGASEWRNFRVLTAICYLNAPDWDEDDGGRLRCYAGHAAADAAAESGAAEGEAAEDAPVRLEVVPRGGTVAVFPSCVVPHEVTPARRPRYAITLWFVSPSLLRGTPEERAAAAVAAAAAAAAAEAATASAAAAAAVVAARRSSKRPRDADGLSVRPNHKRQRAPPSAPPNTPTAPAPNTSRLAAWEAESQGGGGFSFGFD